MSLKYNAERLVEHNNNEQHLEHHTKESLINLYRDLLNLTNELMREREAE